MPLHRRTSLLSSENIMDIDCHCLVRYRRLLARFDPAIKHPDPDFMAPVLPHKIPIIGFSATFGRHDGLALGSVFERIVYHRDFLDMIKEQWYAIVFPNSFFFNLLSSQAL